MKITKSTKILGTAIIAMILGAVIVSALATGSIKVDYLTVTTKLAASGTITGDFPNTTVATNVPRLDASNNFTNNNSFYQMYIRQAGADKARFGIIGSEPLIESMVTDYKGSLNIIPNGTSQDAVIYLLNRNMSSIAAGNFGECVISLFGGNRMRMRCYNFGDVPKITNLSIELDVLPFTASNYNLGSSSYPWGTVYATNYSGNINRSAVNFVIDGSGAVITTGIKGDVEVPVSGTIKTARVLADRTGSITVNVEKDTYANFPPTDADQIGSFVITSNIKSENTTVDVPVTAGDILRFNVSSIATIQRATVSLTIQKS